MHAIDIHGKRFGRLVALTCTARSDSAGSKFWLCRCDCGKASTVSVQSLRAGNSQSCGCLHSELVTARSFKHGDGHVGRVVEYRAWCSMKQRCLNPNAGSYYRYGGRGIQICSQWKDSYETFLKDMGRKPGPEYSIDRIDNDGNYEPDNCRWADKKTQINNRCCSRKNRSN